MLTQQRCYLKHQDEPEKHDGPVDGEKDDDTADEDNSNCYGHTNGKLAQDNGQKSSYDLKNMMLNLAENFVY